MITSKDIQSFILKHWLIKHHCPYICSNFNGAGYPREMDCIAVNGSGYVTEFEIKVSRSDFFADFKKEYKHEVYAAKHNGNLFGLGLERITAASRVPNRFYYAVPKGLIKPEEVPPYAGLIYFNKFSLKDQPGKTFIEFEYATKAPLIHKEKADAKLVEAIARILSQRLILGCALLTYNNKQIKEKYSL